MSDVKHEIPEDLKALCSRMLAPREVGGGFIEAVDFWPIIERISQLTADLSECKRGFFEADSLRATFEEHVKRLSAPVSDEEWGKGCHLANRSHVNDIIANRLEVK